MQEWLPIILVTATGAFVFAFGLIWTTGFVFVGRRAREHATLVFYLPVVGYSLMYFSILTYVIASVQWAAIAWVILMICLIIIIRIRTMSERRRSLLLVASNAAEFGIPVDEALAAYQSDVAGQFGRRGTALLNRLRAGVPLGESMRQTYVFMPTDAHVAVRCESQADEMGRVIQRSVDPDDELNVATKRLAGTGSISVSLCSMSFPWRRSSA